MTLQPTDNPLLNTLIETAGELYILERVYTNELPQNTLDILRARAGLLSALVHDELIARGFVPDQAIDEHEIFSPRLFMEYASNNSFILLALKDENGTDDNDKTAEIDVSGEVEEL